MFEKEIKEAVNTAGYKDDIAEILVSLMNYMRKKNWIGACYATASVLYVCLKECGFDPKLCTGECITDIPFSTTFDHGWVELDGKVIDLACSMTLLGGRPLSPPVVFDKEIITHEKHHIGYGYKGRGLDPQAKMITKMPLNQYMLAFPDEKDGLFGVVNIVLGRKGSIKRLREKYADNPWEYVQLGFDTVQAQRGE